MLNIISSSTFVKFQGFSLKNEPMNVKIHPLIESSIMHILGEVDTLLSNLTEILGQ